MQARSVTTVGLGDLLRAYSLVPPRRAPVARPSSLLVRLLRMLLRALFVIPIDQGGSWESGPSSIGKYPLNSRMFLQTLSNLCK